MNALELLNAWGPTWLEWVWEAGLASLAVLVTVTLVWQGAKKRASAHVGYALFLLPLVPLVVPVARLVTFPVPSPVRLAPLGEYIPIVAARPSAPHTTGMAAVVSASEGKRLAGATDGSANVAAGSEGLTLAGGLLLAWLMTTACLLLRFCAVQRVTQRVVARSRRVSRRDLPEPLRELERDAGLSARLTIRESDQLFTPAVWGVLRPTLVLPNGLLERLDASELRWVFLHELAHVRRRDLLVSSVQRLVQILWFFHPGVWIANRIVEEMRECACDESALARCDDGSRRRCANALLKVAERAAGRRTPVLSLQPFFDNKTSLRNRVMRLIDTHRPARRALGFSSVPWLVVGVTCSLCAVSLSAVGLAPAQQVPDEIEEIIEEVDAAASAVDAGLNWILAGQQADGGWFAGTDASVPDSGEFNRYGVTGLVVLGLTRALDEDPARYAAPLRKALDFLAASQDSNGCFGAPEGLLFVPSHAIATLAWLRGHGGKLQGAQRATAEKAVEFLLRARNPYSGWRYSYPPIGDNDSFVTSLALRALAAARDAGLEVPPDASTAGMGWIEEMTDPATGRTGYDTRGSSVSRLADKKDDFPVEYTEMLTAMGILARLDWGQKPMREEAIRDGVYLVAQVAPFWDELRGSVDYYHWLFGTEALQRLGGYPWEHWRERLLGALLPHQNQNGSWPAIDAWSSEESTVHATALCVLSLQAARGDGT